MIPYPLIFMLTFDPLPNGTKTVASSYIEVMRQPFMVETTSKTVHNCGSGFIIEPVIPDSFFLALSELNNGQLISMDIAMNEPPRSE